MKFLSSISSIIYPYSYPWHSWTRGTREEGDSKVDTGVAEQLKDP